MSRSVDDADIRLIRELSRDGRVSITRLSEETGLSYAAIRNRINRLIKKGLLEIKPHVSVKLLGNVGALVRFKTRNPSKLADMLANCNRVLGVMQNNNGDVIALFFSNSKISLTNTVERIVHLTRDVQEYSIEYGKLVPNMKVPIKNPVSECERCILWKLKFCNGCFPSLRIKKARNKR